MTTVAVCVNKNNIERLTPYLKNIFGNITCLIENEKTWRVTTVGEITKSEFIFDKHDYRSSSDLFSAITAIAE